MQNDLLIRFKNETVNRHSYTQQLFATSWDCAELRLVMVIVLLRGNARRCIACGIVETARNLVSNCVGMRWTAASMCVWLRGYATRKMRGNARSRGFRGNASCEYASNPRVECAGREWDPQLHALASPVFIRDRHVKGKYRARLTNG